MWLCPFFAGALQLRQLSLGLQRLAVFAERTAPRFLCDWCGAAAASSATMAFRDAVSGGVGSVFCVYAGIPFDTVRSAPPFTVERCVQPRRPQPSSRHPPAHPPAKFPMKMDLCWPINSKRIVV